MKRNPVDIVRLSYVGAVLALSVVHGEDAESEPWLALGGFPLHEEAVEMKVKLENQYYTVRLRPLTSAPWVYPSEEFVHVLGSVDDGALEAALRGGGETVDELKRLFSMPGFNSSHGRHFNFSLVLMEWLQEMVKPVLEES
jgi:hypothetical protein